MLGWMRRVILGLALQLMQPTVESSQEGTLIEGPADRRFREDTVR